MSHVAGSEYKYGSFVSSIRGRCSVPSKNAMAKKSKQRKGIEGETNLPQEDTVTGQASSSSAWERAAFTVEPNHELDPDGDLILILNPSSLGYKNIVHNVRSEGIVKCIRLEVRYYCS